MRSKRCLLGQLMLILSIFMNQKEGRVYRNSCRQVSGLLVEESRCPMTFRKQDYAENENKKLLI